MTALLLAGNAASVRAETYPGSYGSAVNPGAMERKYRADGNAVLMSRNSEAAKKVRITCRMEETEEGNLAMYIASDRNSEIDAYDIDAVYDPLAVKPLKAEAEGGEPRAFAYNDLADKGVFRVVCLTAEPLSEAGVFLHIIWETVSEEDLRYVPELRIRDLADSEGEDMPYSVAYTDKSGAALTPSPPKPAPSGERDNVIQDSNVTSAGETQTDGNTSADGNVPGAPEDGQGGRSGANQSENRVRENNQTVEKSSGTTDSSDNANDKTAAGAETGASGGSREDGETHESVSDSIIDILTDSDDLPETSTGRSVREDFSGAQREDAEKSSGARDGGMGYAAAVCVSAVFMGLGVFLYLKKRRG